MRDLSTRVPGDRVTATVQRTHEQTYTHPSPPYREHPDVPPGPWDDEPDKVVWVHAPTGMDCMVNRGHSGAWCGYVGVPPGHPWHGKDYDDVDARVWGGLTYSDACEESDDPAVGICHVPAEGRPHDVWWLGYDHAHGGDVIPGYRDWNLPGDGARYATVDDVRGEVEDLARQAAEVVA